MTTLHASNVSNAHLHPTSYSPLSSHVHSNLASMYHEFREELLLGEKDDESACLYLAAVSTCSFISVPSSGVRTQV